MERSGFILLLIIINSVKYAYTNIPILLTDIGYLKNIFEITSLVKDDIISNINIQIQRLYDEIQKIDEPTIIVVLGDHLPYIPNLEWEDILEKTTLFNTGNEKEDLLRKYTTETLILSNYEYNIKFDTEYVSPDLILTTIINNIDIDIDGCMKLEI